MTELEKLMRNQNVWWRRTLRRLKAAWAALRGAEYWEAGGYECIPHMDCAHFCRDVASEVRR